MYSVKKGLFKNHLEFKPTPRHKAEKVSLINGYLYTDDGKRPISSATISITPDCQIVFNGTTKTSVKAKSFEAFSRGFVFTTEDNTVGYVASNGNVVNPELEDSTIIGVDVYDAYNLVFYKKADNKTGEVFYSIGSALSGDEYKGMDRFTSCRFAKKSDHMPRNILILGNPDGTYTFTNERFAPLSDSVIKYDQSDLTLYLLSKIPGRPNETILECFDFEAIKKTSDLQEDAASIPHLKPKHCELGVVDFETSFRELITYNGETSTVYEVSPHNEGSAVIPKFTKEGVVKNVAPIFSCDQIYMQTTDKKNTLLLADGSACTNPELEGVKAIRDRYGYAYIIDVETKNGIKQGLYRTGDLSTLFPPCDQIRMIGERSSRIPNETESLFIATHGDTFAIGKLELYKSDAYLPADVLVGFNNYFNPQLTNEECKLYAQDSYGRDGVLDCSTMNKAPVFSDIVSYASRQLGYPIAPESKPTEVIESEDILVK